MFATYLRRELTNRRKQSIIIAIGMALAIALVIVVNSVSAGVKDAQAAVLKSVYGVGTDITVTKPAQAPGQGTTANGPGRGRFDFGADSGDADSSTGSREVHQSRLESRPDAPVMASSALTRAKSVTGVAAAAGVLSLTNSTFDGTLPNFQQLREAREDRGGSGAAASTPAPTGGADGAGGSSFTVSSFSVLGIDPAGSDVGPLSATTLAKGRAFTKSDTGKHVAVLDTSYAKAADLALDDTITVGGTDFTIVGLVSASGSDATTASNVYVPLDVAQTLSGNAGKISTIYVTAASADDIAQVKTALEKKLPSTTVSTQADLASTVSGSLGSAGELVAGLGTWLSLIVLAAAFLIAILFTISGVTRRTREFGTLKAIGWSNRRVVGQVAGESVVQGLIGGVIGIAVGLIGILVVNLLAPTLSGTLGQNSTADAAGRLGRLGGAAGTTGAGGASAGGFGGGGAFTGAGPGGFTRQAAASTDVVLNAPVTLWVILIAVGLAVLGGLIAGAIGGWRASRLRPAAALRSVA
ncbi:ABC transporter permease [Microbacterium sp. STN6]|uniref:ABC transporter permease n=1 Tax=Microbacterium sp. STN6 TaxID=2995588 RepID=UPI002260FC2D|nr:ABC transporter permease [Microbacterium sp. STN6]MCX7520780.1 ABC transporter permease [Microbacterium sp. STN6]